MLWPCSPVRAAALFGVALFAAIACGSSPTSSQSSSTSTAAIRSPSPGSGFEVTTPEGQVSVSLDGRLPPNWPTGFPVPSGATVAGSGSVIGSSLSWMVGVYSTSASAPDTFAYYTSAQSGLTTTGVKTVGAGSTYVGSAKITAPYTGSVTVLSRNNRTYIVTVLKPPGASPTS